MDVDTLSRAMHQSEIYRIFSNPIRILIIWSLKDNELTVGKIAEEVNASLQNTSHHLRLMKDKGILNSRRDGQSIYYRIKNPELVEELLNKAPVRSEKHSSVK